MNLKLLVGSIALVVLSGCASVTPEVSPPPERVVDRDGLLVCRIPLEIDRPSPVQWHDFEWRVLNDEIVEGMLRDGESVRYFALTYEDYKRLALTVQDVLRYTRVQDAIIEEMEAYYQPVAAPIIYDEVDNVDE